MLRDYQTPFGKSRKTDAFNPVLCKAAELKIEDVKSTTNTASTESYTMTDTAQDETFLYNQLSGITSIMGIKDSIYDVDHKLSRLENIYLTNDKNFQRTPALAYPF